MAEQLMRAQLKGSTAAINSTAGYKGVLVLNTDTNHLHVLTGEAGNNIELANKTDIPENVDISGKADISYVNTQLNTKLGKTEKATSAKVADSATKATRDASGNVITSTYATKSEVTSGLAGKQPVGDYATTTALTEGLATKLGATAKAVSAGTADSATKATQDGSGNVISSTYATKSEVTSGLSGKLGKTEKASSANTADAVAWAGVIGKPSFARVATTGSYNDLTDKPSVSFGVFRKIMEQDYAGEGTKTLTIINVVPNKLLYVRGREPSPPSGMWRGVDFTFSLGEGFYDAEHGTNSEISRREYSEGNLYHAYNTYVVKPGFYYFMPYSDTCVLYINMRRSPDAKNGPLPVRIEVYQ